MNIKQTIAIAALLTASGVVMAQAPASQKTATGATMTHNKPSPAKEKSALQQHDHKTDDGPKKTIHSGA